MSSRYTVSPSSKVSAEVLHSNSLYLISVKDISLKTGSSISRLEGRIRMGLFDRILGKKKPKNVPNLEELIRLVGNRNYSDMPKITAILQENLTELSNDSTGRLLNLDGKIAVHRLVVTTEGVFGLIDTIVKKADDAILNFNIIATPHYGIAQKCNDFMLKQGFSEKDLACITPSMDDNAEMEVLEKVKSGECKFLIADAYRLVSRWQLNNLKILSDNLKAKANTKSLEGDPLISLFLVDPESMTSTQVERALEVIDAREGSPTNSIFQKYVISIISAESARESKALRDMKKPEDPWEVDLVVKGLPKAIYENDCQNLARWIHLIPSQSNPSAAWELIDDATSLIRKLKGY